MFSESFLTTYIIYSCLQENLTAIFIYIKFLYGKCYWSCSNDNYKARFKRGIQHELNAINDTFDVLYRVMYLQYTCGRPNIKSANLVPHI